MPFDAPVISTTRSWKFILIFNPSGSMPRNYRRPRRTSGRQLQLNVSVSPHFAHLP